QRQLWSLPAPRIVTAAGVRWWPAANARLALTAVRAPRPAGKRFTMAAFDIGVDPREDDRDERGKDRAPKRERQEAHTAHETAAHVRTLASAMPGAGCQPNVSASCRRPRASSGRVCPSG